MSRLASSSRTTAAAGGQGNKAAAGAIQLAEFAQEKRGVPRKRRDFGGRAAPSCKVTVVLLNRQVAFLDHIVINIRSDHGEALARSHIIQALIEAAMQRGMDLSRLV